ncbi:NB-ARC domain-containing protein [Planktothrix paucivesiculata]|uniref:ATPase domain-containing protein n=1 Tax=Planktothrix paucivesiculata PCC 9631 TaxID=671071 RepID=A0A7Z9BV48_9CYAN|nr:ATP-binding protein [Planktothrix paucivesiculata]VXD20170.1 ATPase domain-containing protein [Planktothrix paucivesiculata PCC 9631]
MTITEILQIADRLVFSQTGKHLDDLQETVIKGVWQGQTYQVIADECQYSESRVRDVGYKLWEILSAQLGEHINKCNFRSTFERLDLALSQFIDIQNSNDFRFCSYPHQSLNNDQKVQSNQQHPYCNLKEAPRINHCYGRENQLSTLSHWLEDRNTNLISILGIAGIGKSTLVRYFLDLNTQPFDVIIWKNLKLSQSFNFNITEILTNIHANNTENIFNKFMNLLHKKQCLIIFDNIEEIFIPEQLAGIYKPEYQDYQKIFTMITQTEHQSKVILVSQEKCTEMHCLDKQLYPIKYLELSGLDDIKILDNTGLNNQDSWLKLIRLYEGNPTYLKNIVSLIQDVYDGEVADFLEENSLIITQTMESHFNDLFNRLSSIEQQIILELSKSDQLISREDLKQKLPLSSVDFVKGLQSLQQRYLVTKIKEEKVMFKLSPFFREYVKNRCKD